MYRKLARSIRKLEKYVLLKFNVRNLNQYFLFCHVRFYSIFHYIIFWCQARYKEIGNFKML